MGILDDLTPIEPKRTCRIRTVLETLEESDQKVLTEALKNTADWSVHGLHSALAIKGIEVSTDAIKRHRRGICNCSKI